MLVAGNSNPFSRWLWPSGLQSLYKDTGCLRVSLRCWGTARNAVVHRGHYYDDDTNAAENENLWEHILVTREVVVRFILTALGYKGRYISFLGGGHPGRPGTSRHQMRHPA
jgi:hypothetical protein